MKKQYTIAALLLALLSVSSCVDEINLEIVESNQALVVDAWMGNVPEDTYVKIYRTVPYMSGILNPDYLSVPVTRVEIEEKDGQTIPFSQVEPTVFKQTWSFQPSPGKSYRLLVETAEGEVFESSWEVMPPLVEIEDIVAKAIEKEVMLTSGAEPFFQTQTFAEVRAKLTDPGLGEFGYLIRTSGITELYTSSSNDRCRCVCFEDDPDIFAGMNVVSNKNFQGVSFQATIGDVSLSYLGRYFVSTKVKTLNKSGLDYLNRVNDQQRNTGSIFDPAPSRVKGNIKKKGAENETVLGGFFLFQESQHEQMLYRSQIRSSAIGLNHRIEPLPVVVGSCTEYYFGATAIPPDPFLP
ncbi:DUF4249 family protein [Algoriphagus aestuariicola]|jgi:hypothetical protein|uniref:DUF4249 family protein n=1 Tax=Algoriphagus aestuariicola TaxID=1852016 RepID=A0ABS3BPV7_9BACT|nr:DUF4249 domain-containing protein [Algoriphagus aestuariicola]MBN7800941.1 DUF4249 family protein [Algoriphagus aestuariicola]